MRRRWCPFLLLLPLAAVFVVLAVTATQSLWSPRENTAASLGPNPPSSVLTGLSQPLKPARPAFEIPEQASETQHRVAQLRDRSFEVAERLVDAFPACAEAHHVLGTVHQRHRHEAGAVQLWERCLHLDPGFADAHYSLGRLAFTKGDYTTAESHLRQAMELAPRSATIPLQLAEALMPLGQFTDAAKVLETFVTHHPDSAEGWVRLGQAYQQAGDAQNAKCCHLRAIELDPEQLDAYYGAGLALQKLGESQRAAQYLEKFRKFRSQQPRMAPELSPERGDLLRMEITLTNTYMLAGEIHGRHGDAAGMERNWRAAAEFDAEHRESRFRLAELYHHVGRYDQALRFFREYCELEPDNSGAWLSLGVLAVRSRQYQEAEAALRRAIELAPQQPKAYAVLAQIRMLPDRDPEEAVALARRAVELAPSAEHFYILGTARWHAGQTVAAREDLAQAVKLDPGNREYREAYAHLLQEP